MNTESNGFVNRRSPVQSRPLAPSLLGVNQPLFAIGPDNLVGKFMVLSETFTGLSVNLKPASKKYRGETLLYLKRTWPELENIPVNAIVPMDCLKWAASLKYSPTRYNALIGMLKEIFGLAVSAGVIQFNPASNVERMPVRIKPPKLPSDAQFKAILDHLKTSPQCLEAFRMVKFIACSGLRISEARKLRREDITDLGIRIEDQKNGETSYAPILPELRELLKGLPMVGPLFSIKNPRRALRTACKLAGVTRMTNHTLRHLFATHGLECGVDIKTVSAWLRHKDGGVLAMKRYTHVRDEHAAAMVQRVKPYQESAPVSLVSGAGCPAFGQVNFVPALYPIDAIGGGVNVAGNVWAQLHPVGVTV